MRKHHLVWLASAVLFGAAMFIAGGVVAQEGGEGAPPPGTWQQPEWMKLGEKHEVLAKLAGEWKVGLSFKMTPEAPPTKSEGKAVGTLVLGGRFLSMTFESVFMGQAYEGRLLLGYDTVDKVWTSIWCDNMTPVMSISRGKEGDGLVRYESMDPDYMDPAGKKIPMVVTSEWNNDDRYTMKFYTVRGGKEIHSGTIVYDRVKEE